MKTMGYVGLSLVLLTFMASCWLGSCQQGGDDAGRTIALLARQLMVQQFAAEEKVRSDGHSGIKQVRHHSAGTRPYYSESHCSATTQASLHEHADNIRTLGLGELVVALNGVEFRTRHNDHELRMPDTSSRKYHAAEEIPFPGVPPEVSSQPTLATQMEEMRQWFRAWKEQDFSKRDYRKFFKPVLCYMEGAWTTSTSADDLIDEPFFSERHVLDADTWLDLSQKIRFSAYSGAKSERENFAFLPTSVVGVANGTVPVFAQWNYRIMCHPLSRDLPLDRFRVVNEVATRMHMPSRKTVQELSLNRAARFQLNPSDGDTWREGTHVYGLLDELMSEIPGKDNYQGWLRDEINGLKTFQYGTNESLNAAFYHRWYTVKDAGAMGARTRHRGFSDDTVFMAMTTQEKVAGVETCSGPTTKSCVTQKWTYAIPLEILYLTPLNSWNPFDITYKGSSETPLGATVTEGGNRDGGESIERAFNGTNSRAYYITPKEYFVGGEIQTSPADTTQGSVYVLDEDSATLHKMAASGVRIFLPEIPGVGVLRQRYPIMPVHGEGNGAWKELEALKDLVLEPRKNARLFGDAVLSGVSSNACQLVWLGLLQLVLVMT